MARYAREPNLMEHYLDSDTYVYQIIGTLRGAYLSGNRPRIDKSHITLANREVLRTIAGIDESTFPFAEDLGALVLSQGSNQKNMVFLLIGGTLLGSEEEDSDRAVMNTSVGFDLGKNPWRVFSRGEDVKENTKDAYTTREYARRFMASRRYELQSMNICAFLVEHSSFYYLNENTVREFFGRGIMMDKIIPYISENRGHIGLEESKTPAYSEFEEYAPKLWVNYRLKRSLEDKLLRKITEDKRIKEPIGDWVAHRIVVPTFKDVSEWKDFFEPPKEMKTGSVYSISIGNNNRTTIEYLSTDDYYDKPKKSGYKAIHIVARVHTKGKEPAVREIQIVDLKQFYKNEIDPDPKSRIAHGRYKRKQRPSRRKREFVENYRSVLEQIFGSSTMILKVE